MRKKFRVGTIPKIIKAFQKPKGGTEKVKKDPVSKMLKDPKMIVKAPSKQMQEAKIAFKKLINKYKNKPLDDEAVKKGYKIFTKK
tara:strand:+ start:33 stop:287 length:255 start_codon:yes stop_codon:yes gene_type:complete